jgi:O-antigen/teichoic acid export membrane protein
LTSVVTQGGLFVTNLGLARILGRSPFGEWATLQSTVYAAAGIAQLSMALTATKYVAQYRATRPERAGSVLGLCALVTLATGALASLAIVAGAGILAGTVLQAPHLAPAIRLSAVGVFFLTVGGYQIGALAGLERFRASAILTVANGALSLTLVLSGAWRFGLLGAIGGFALAQLASWASHRYVLNLSLREVGIFVDWRKARNEVAEVAFFTVPATLAGVAGMLGMWGSSVALVRGSGGYSEMALFAAASTFRGLVLFPPTVIQRVSSAVLTAMSGRGEHAMYRRALSHNVLTAFASAGAVAVPVALLGPWLLLIFGSAFRGGGLVVALLALAGLLEATTNAFSQEYVTSGRMWANLRVVVVRSTLLVVVTAALSQQFGALGGAWAAVAAHSAAAVLSALTARPRLAEAGQQERSG